ncbi:MAG: FtsW/RodA/SpoVE family cell cycle protein [Ruminococcus sp.]|nr:FtsW/RodA/SpoVE family cell cycle protein [Ruminococcus sp.]
MTLIMDIAVVALRMLLPVYTVVIVYQIFAAMRRRRRPERPLVMLQDVDTGEKIPVLFWENSIGRARGSDIAIDDPAVSRNHCVLLRRKEGWFITDTGSKTGTYVNDKRVGSRRTMLNIDDTISMGNKEYAFRRGEDFHEELRSSWFFSKVSNKPAIQPYKILILVSLFHVFMAVEACFCDGAKDFDPAVLCGFLVGVEWMFFAVSRLVLKREAFELEALGLFFTGIGVMLLARQNVKNATLQPAYVQLIAAVVGIIAFCIVIKFIENPDRIGQWRLIIMIAAVLLLGVNLVFGRVTNGSANWVHIGPVTVQPSEFVKIAFIFVGASTLDRLQTRQNLLEFIIFSAICVGALALMGDFGTALIFFGTFLLISFTRSGDFKTVILALTGAGLGGFIVLNMKPYVLRRFQGWRHVWEYTQDSRGYQQARVLTYIASGGLFGVGIGNGVLKYVAASESDLVFGLMSEEMGFISAVTIAIAIATLFIYARSVTTRSRSTFYSISACCAAGLFVIQMSLNVFGATDILPLTGVTFPFISAGGSSIISCWGLLAFIKAADERTYAK